MCSPLDDSLWPPPCLPPPKHPCVLCCQESKPRLARRLSPKTAPLAPSIWNCSLPVSLPVCRLAGCSSGWRVQEALSWGRASKRGALPALFPEHPNQAANSSCCRCHHLFQGSGSLAPFLSQHPQHQPGQWPSQHPAVLPPPLRPASAASALEAAWARLAKFAPLSWWG